MAPWYLTLGTLDELQPAIEREPEGRLTLHFEATSEWPELPQLRVAMVQPGRQIELHPLHAPARSLPLPRPMAPLDDLWLLVRAPTRRYWFEVPYGVCGTADRNGDTPQAGPPRPPPGALLDDAVIPWRAIRFSLGRAGDCQLELAAASAHPGEIDLEAIRTEPGPPPEISVASSLGAPRLLEPWRASGVEHGHVARYGFSPDQEAQSARAYARLVIGEDLELALPTSLTDPDHRSAARHRIGRGS